MAVTTSGKDPNQFYFGEISRLVKILNETAVGLEGDLVKASPVGVEGGIKGGWSFIRASQSNQRAIVGQSRNYFLPVELGRKPGKGISREGQESVMLWAKRVLGLSDQEAKGFAYQLSKRYFREGRAAQGFAGLAREGETPTSSRGDTLEPIEGGLIQEAFNQMRRELFS